MRSELTQVTGCLLLLVVSHPAVSQDDGASRTQGSDAPLFAPAHDVYDRGGFAYVFGGVNFIDMDSINRVLAERGYGPIADQYLAYGTGAFVTFQRFLLGLEFYDTFSNTSERALNRSDFDGGYWAAHLAYLFNLGPIHVYPMLGAGFANFTLQLAQGETDFESVLDDPPLQQRLEADGFLLQLAIGIEYLLKTSEDDDRVTGVLLGVRLGYFAEPFGLNWSVSGADSSGAPGIGTGVPYFNLVAGFGSWRTSDHGIPFLE